MQKYIDLCEKIGTMGSDDAEDQLLEQLDDLWYTFSVQEIQIVEKIALENRNNK